MQSPVYMGFEFARAGKGGLVVCFPCVTQCCVSTDALANYKQRDGKNSADLEKLLLFHVHLPRPKFRLHLFSATVTNVSEANSRQGLCLLNFWHLCQPLPWPRQEEQTWTRVLAGRYSNITKREVTGTATPGATFGRGIGVSAKIAATAVAADCDWHQSSLYCPRLCMAGQDAELPDCTSG